MQPTLAGFLNFLRTTVGITTAVLPDSSPVIGMAFAVALSIVNPALRCIPIPAADSSGARLNGGGLTIYALAVYNLAASNLFSFAQDAEDAPLVTGSKLPYFADKRDKWHINEFVSGVIQSSGDESTNNSMVVQEAAKNFTIANLTQLKDPYGRQYLSLAQSYGPSTWGLS